MKYLGFFINVLIGLVFLASAILKLFPVEYLEIKITGFGLEQSVLVSVLARLLIGVELLLGLLLVAQVLFNGRLIRVVQWLLLAFIAVNIVDVVLMGNEGNCGCFGQQLHITPVQSIVKNVVMLGLLFISARYSEIEWKPLAGSVKFLVFFLPFTFVFLYRPVLLHQGFGKGAEGKKLDLTIMDGHPGLKGKTFSDDLMKGKRVVAFLSLTCKYCKLAGYKLSIIKSKNPDLPIYQVINGDSTEMKQFYEATNSYHVPTAHFNGKEDFLELSGNILPAVYLIDNGIIHSKENHATISEKQILQWMKE